MDAIDSRSFAELIDRVDKHWWTGQSLNYDGLKSCKKVDSEELMGHST